MGQSLLGTNRIITMITIEITEDVSTKQDMVYLLEHIAKMIEEGYTSGYYPTWALSGEESLENEE